MGQDILVGIPVEEGRRFVEAVHKSGVRTTVALWMFDAEIRDWRLVLSAPSLDRLGPLAGYRALRKILDGLRPEVEMDLGTIVIANANEPMIRALRSAVAVQWPGGSRFTGCVFNGVVVDDAYAYQISPAR